MIRLPDRVKLHMISSPGELDFLTMQATLGPWTSVGLDTESTFSGKLALLQVAIESEVFLIDTIAIAMKDIRTFLASELRHDVRGWVARLFGAGKSLFAIAAIVSHIMPSPLCLCFSLSLSSGSLKVAIFVLSFVLLILVPEDGAEVAMVPPTLPRLMCRTWQCLGETNGKSSHRKAGIWRIGAGHQSCVQRWSEIHPLPCHVLLPKLLELFALLQSF